jgi:hypothetical protein
LEIDITPEKEAERAMLFPNRQVTLGVFNRGLDFTAVADDAGVGEQARQVMRIVAGDLFRVEIVERAPIMVPLAQDGQPVEAGLRAFENQHLEQAAVVVNRYAPLFIVIELI